MKFYAVIALLILMSVGGCASRTERQSDRYEGGFRSAEDAYKIGYEEGSHHGQEDARLRLPYDYKHAHSSRTGLNYDRYTNEDYRRGYERGYKDGYYLRR